MKLAIVAAGRMKEPETRSLLADYYGRIRRYAQLEEFEVREEREEKMAAAYTKALANYGPRAELIALDVQGRALSSEAFARALGNSLDAARVPVFAIGAAEGLPESIRKSAAWKLSLGPMTLPHRLARIILAEQIYRGFTILRGEPYAREG